MSPYSATQQFGTECLRTVPLNNLVQNVSLQCHSTIFVQNVSVQCHSTIWYRMSPYSATQQFGTECLRTVPLNNLVQNVSVQCHSTIWYRMSPYSATQQFGTEFLRTVKFNNLVQNVSVQCHSTISVIATVTAVKTNTLLEVANEFLCLLSNCIVRFGPNYVRQFCT